MSGRFDGDPCAFFVIAIDGKPSLEAIYVPPELRNQRLGSSLLVAMAAMMHTEQISQIQIRATPESVRFFERFGAEVVPGGSPAPHEWTLMELDSGNLKRPENWFEGNVARSEESIN
ncbi:MAG: GNAT family N-acetyltransferase [Rhodospirillaceae bacterium]|nr:GNAT family N-acetyltransferase [Rhodospirillaceae bacterium]